MKKSTLIFTMLIIGIIALLALPAINNSNLVTDNTDMSKKNKLPDTNTVVEMQTNMGNVRIELFNSTMPITAGNFLKLAQEGFYDGVIFHRVIPNFMIQGGDPTGTGMGGPGYKIPDEFTKENHNNRGTISMANSGPNTGGSQFFINVVDNNYLDPKHPVFGKIISGLEVADAISNVETTYGDRPLSEVSIERIVVVD